MAAQTAWAAPKGSVVMGEINKSLSLLPLVAQPAGGQGSCHCPLSRGTRWPEPAQAEEGVNRGDLQAPAPNQTEKSGGGSLLGNYSSTTKSPGVSPRFQFWHRQGQLQVTTDFQSRLSREVVQIRFPQPSDSWLRRAHGARVTGRGPPGRG